MRSALFAIGDCGMWGLLNVGHAHAADVSPPSEPLFGIVWNSACHGSFMPKAVTTSFADFPSARMLRLGIWTVAESGLTAVRAPAFLSERPTVAPAPRSHTETENPNRCRIAGQNLDQIRQQMDAGHLIILTSGSEPRETAGTRGKLHVVNVTARGTVGDAHRRLLPLVMTAASAPVPRHRIGVAWTTGCAFAARTENDATRGVVRDGLVRAIEQLPADSPLALGIWSTLALGIWSNNELGLHSLTISVPSLSARLLINDHSPEAMGQPLRFPVTSRLLVNSGPVAEVVAESRRAELQRVLRTSP